MSNIVSINNASYNPHEFIAEFVQKHPKYKFIIISKTHMSSIHDAVSNVTNAEKVVFRGNNNAVKDFFKNNISIVAGPSFFKGAQFSMTAKKYIRKNNYMLIMDHCDPSPYGVGKKLFNIFENVMVVESRDYNKMNDYMNSKNIKYRKYHILEKKK